MDVVTAFLGSSLDEEVYVILPEGVFSSIPARLNHSLYGVKQSPRCWCTTIDSFLLSKLCFCRGRFDRCIYTYPNSTILALYLDDMLIAGTSQNINSVRKRLKDQFEMVDLGYVNNFLG